MKHKIEFDEKCPSCDGTGLYVGICERDGAAVICFECKGTGKHRVVFEYEDFKKRELRAGVKRVYQASAGVMIGKGSVEGKQYRLEDFGGMSYKDWLEGKPFPPASETRKFTCPAWWYQTIDYKRKPKWSNCKTMGFFGDCSRFRDKASCWKRWDLENGTADKIK